MNIGGIFSTILNGLTGGVSGDITDVGATLAAFFGTITDGKMWRSLGWLFLGIIMIGIGINFLTRDLQAKVAAPIAKAAELGAL